MPVKTVRKLAATAVLSAIILAIPLLSGCSKKKEEAPPPPAVKKASGLPVGSLAYMSEGSLWFLRKGAKPEALIEGAIWFPALSPDCSMIAYWEDRGEVMMLSVINVVSKQVTRIGQWSSMGPLGRNQNLRNAPWWSPNSEKLYFADGKQVWEVLPDGHDLQTVYEHTAGCYSPTVSPDGNWVCFVSVDGRQQNLWFYSRLTHNAEAVTDFTQKEGTVGAPAWSPDGLRIAFVLYKSEKVNVWTMLVAGKNSTPLTREGRTNAPSWDPLGKMLAVSSGTQNIYAWQIALVNVDDGKFLSPLAAPSSGAFTPSIGGEW
jgi:Tol biopolymer transport system component